MGIESDKAEFNPAVTQGLRGLICRATCKDQADWSNMNSRRSVGARGRGFPVARWAPASRLTQSDYFILLSIERAQETKRPMRR